MLELNRNINIIFNQNNIILNVCYNVSGLIVVQLQFNF